MSDLMNIDHHIIQSPDVESVERLMIVRREIEALESRKAYQRDFSALQTVLPSVVKSGKAAFSTKKGGRVQYSYCKIDDLTSALQPYLHQYGFSFYFQQKELGGVMAVACIVMHAEGHRERIEMSAPVTGTDAMSTLQAMSSTISFLKRITFKSAFGLSETDRTPVQNALQEKKYYPDHVFKVNFPVWQLKIASGRISPQQLFEFLKTKGIHLSPDQQNSIMRCGE